MSLHPLVKQQAECIRALRARLQTAEDTIQQLAGLSSPGDERYYSSSSEDDFSGFSDDGDDTHPDLDLDLGNSVDQAANMALLATTRRAMTTHDAALLTTATSSMDTSSSDASPVTASGVDQHDSTNVQAHAPRKRIFTLYNFFCWLLVAYIAFIVFIVFTADSQLHEAQG